MRTGKGERGKGTGGGEEEGSRCEMQDGRERERADTGSLVVVVMRLIRCWWSRNIEDVIRRPSLLPRFDLRLEGDEFTRRQPARGAAYQSCHELVSNYEAAVGFPQRYTPKIRNTHTTYYSRESTPQIHPARVRGAYYRVIVLSIRNTHQRSPISIWKVLCRSSYLSSCVSLYLDVVFSYFPGKHLPQFLSWIASTHAYEATLNTTSVR